MWIKEPRETFDGATRGIRAKKKKTTGDPR
jgi:hypothetical protein